METGTHPGATCLEGAEQGLEAEFREIWDLKVSGRWECPSPCSGKVLGGLGTRGPSKGTSGDSFTPHPQRGGTEPAGRGRQSSGTRLSPLVPASPHLAPLGSASLHLSLQGPACPPWSSPGPASPCLPLRVLTCPCRSQRLSVGPRLSPLVPTWFCRSPSVPASPCLSLPGSTCPHLFL